MVTRRRKFQLLEPRQDDILINAITDFLLLIRDLEPRQINDVVRRLLCVGYFKAPQLLSNPGLVENRIGQTTVYGFRIRIDLDDPVEADMETVFSQIKRNQVNALFTDLVMIGYRSIYLEHCRRPQQIEAVAKINGV